jgi:hypothetical protein
MNENQVEQPTGDLTDEQIIAFYKQSCPGLPDARSDARTNKMVFDFARAIASAAIAAHLARQPKAESTLSKICDMLHIGVLARDDGAILTSVRNILRREHCLSAIEREFFMVAAEPDEDFPGDDPGEDCLLNWGSEPADYVEQFRAAIAQKSASPASQEDAYLARQAQAEPTEEMVRFCPHCARIGEVGAQYRDCCPDGSAARVIPKRLAEVCRDTFRLAIDNVAAPVAPAGAQNLQFLINVVADAAPMLRTAGRPKTAGLLEMAVRDLQGSAGAQNAEAIRNQATADELREEAAKLAPILRGMCEGGGEERDRDIYADDYQPGDGDVFVIRAADLLDEIATGSANTQEGGE